MKRTLVFEDKDSQIRLVHHFEESNDEEGPISYYIIERAGEDALGKKTWNSRRRIYPDEEEFEIFESIRISKISETLKDLKDL